MNVADIKRPEIVVIKEEDMRIELSSSQNVTNQQTGELIDILIAPTLVVSDKKDEDGKHELPVDPNMFTNDRLKLFNNLTYSLGKMVRLAELNLDTLSDVISLYLQLHSKDEILARNADCKKLEAILTLDFHKLTFGNLRNILSCIVKTDQELQKIPELDTPEKRKNYTSVYNNYIQDRDYYTHGILFFFYPEFAPVLRIKLATGEAQYVRYDKKVFTDNLMTHGYLSDVLHKMREILQQQILDKNNAGN